MFNEAILPGEWDVESDIIIIGGGTAGFCAAIEARKAGSGVVVLEQAPTPNGSLSVCAGNINFAGSPYQKERFIEDSPDNYYKDGLEGCKGDPAMWRKFMDNHLDTYDLIVGLGYKPIDIWLLPGHNITRSHYFEGGGPQLLKLLEKGAKENGADIRFKHRAVQLYVDMTNKRVVGVKAESGGKTVNFKANKAVIIASGGFGNNPKMVTEFRGEEYAKRCLPTMKGHTGEGIKMAMSIGVATSHIGTAAMPSIPMDAVTKIPDAITLHHTLCGSIFVNMQGKRYVDECLQIFPYLGEASFAQEGEYVFTIYDSVIRDMIHLINWDIFKEFQDDTIEGLATQLGIEPADLVAGIKEYNDDIDQNGYDTKFGKKLLLGPHKIPPVKVEKPPFYGIKLMDCFTSYKGGLKTNTESQALDYNGNVVPGLYIAGECQGGLFAEGSYLCGTMICYSMTFGRIAGINAAAE